MNRALSPGSQHRTKRSSRAPANSAQQIPPTTHRSNHPLAAAALRPASRSPSRAAVTVSPQPSNAVKAFESLVYGAEPVTHRQNIVVPTGIPRAISQQAYTELIGGWEPVDLNMAMPKASKPEGSFAGQPETGVANRRGGSRPVQLGRGEEKASGLYPGFDADISQSLLEGEEGSAHFRERKPNRLHYIGLALALIGSLGLFVFAFLLGRRDRTQFYTFKLILGAFGVFAAFLIGAALRKIPKTPSQSKLFLIALLFAALFACAMAAAIVSLLLHFPFHFAKLSVANTNKLFSKAIFEKIARGDRRFLIFAPFFAAIAAIGFGVSAIGFWRLSRKSERLTRSAISALSFAAVLAFLFGLFRLHSARASDFGGETPTLGALALFGWIGVALLLLILLASALRKRAPQMLFGGIGALYIISLAVLIFVTIRRTRKNQFDNVLAKKGEFNCAEMLSAAHEKSIRGFCPRKYIPFGEVGERTMQTTHWESNNAPRFLNSNCCAQIATFRVWPIFVGAMLFVLAISLFAAAIVFALSLVEKAEYRQFADKRVARGELAFFAAALLALLFFLPIIGFGRKARAPRTVGRSRAWRSGAVADALRVKAARNFTFADLERVYGGFVPENAFGDWRPRGEGFASRAAHNAARDAVIVAPSITGKNITKTPIGNAPSLVWRNGEFFNGFADEKPIYRLARNGELNPISVLAEFAAPKTFAMRTKNPILTLSADVELCRDFGHCGFRFGLLIFNGRATPFPQNVAGIGPTDTRSVFFSDADPHNDFLSFCGTPEDLNRLFAAVRVTPIDPFAPTALFFKGEQLRLGDIDARCLRTGEGDSRDAPLSEGLSNYLVKGHATARDCYYDNSCNSDLHCFENSGMIVCKKAFVFYPSDGEVKVTVPLKVKDVEGGIRTYKGVPLRSTSFIAYGERRFALEDEVFKDGQMTFSVPRPINGYLDVHLQLHDPVGHYLSATAAFTLAPHTPITHTTPNLVLLTRDGRGCLGASDVAGCFAKKRILHVNVELTARDSQRGAPLSKIPISLISGRGDGRTLAQHKTDRRGRVAIATLPIDAYTVYFAGNKRFLPAKAAFTLEHANPLALDLPLRRRKGATAIYELSGEDWGAHGGRAVCLSVVGQEGGKCRLTPKSRYCAFAEYLLENGKVSYQRIRIARFAVAYYLAYTCELPTNNYPITANEPQNKGKTPTHENVSKQTVRDEHKSPNVYTTLSCFTGWGLNTLRSFRVDSTTEPRATLCAPLFPSASPWSLARLAAANASK